MDDKNWICNLPVGDLRKAAGINDTLFVGPPGSTAHYTGQILENAGMVGIYKGDKEAMLPLQEAYMHDLAGRNQRMHDDVKQYITRWHAVSPNQTERQWHSTPSATAPTTSRRSPTS